MSQFHAFSHPTLIQSLCALPRVAPLPASAFFLSRRGPNFHCESFFRTEQCPPTPFNPRQPLFFKDGRVYEIEDIKLVRAFEPDIACRCLLDVIERKTGEFLPFEMWFYQTAFEEGEPQESFKNEMMQITRQWVWEFLYTKRNAVDWSRYGLPYIEVCR